MTVGLVQKDYSNTILSLGWVVLFFFITSCVSQQQFDVLKISNVPFPKSVDPAASLSAPFTKNITEFTFCYRLLIDSYNEEGFRIIEAKPKRIESLLFREYGGLDSGFELDGFQFMSFYH